MMKYRLSRNVIMSYDDLFIGLTDRLPINIFSNISPAVQHATALELFHYAFDTRLHWSPTEIRDYLTMEIIKDLKLQPVFRYIQFPNGLIPENSLFYLAWLIYPKTKNKSIQDVELTTYHRYLDGAIKKLPLNYFTDSYGVNRALNCLIDRLNYYQPFKSNDPFYVYEFFVSPGCVPFLGNARLLKICAMLNINPLEYFFMSLNDSQRDYLMYSYYEFMLQYDSVKKIEPMYEDTLIYDDDEPILGEDD